MDDQKLITAVIGACVAMGAGLVYFLQQFFPKNSNKTLRKDIEDLKAKVDSNHAELYSNLISTLKSIESTMKNVSAQVQENKEKITLFERDNRQEHQRLEDKYLEKLK